MTRDKPFIRVVSDEGAFKAVEKNPSDMINEFWQWDGLKIVLILYSA
jgi:hypothetical protein